MKEINKDMFLEKRVEFITKNEEETKKIAKLFAKTLKKGDIVLLKGDLGAGKTVFVKGISSAFSSEEVLSPTFTLLNIYKGPIYHFDMYRVENENELYNIGFTDYLYGKGYCIIEWPERIKSLPVKKYIMINIQKLENGRKIIIER